MKVLRTVDQGSFLYTETILETLEDAELANACIPQSFKYRRGDTISEYIKNPSFRLFPGLDNVIK